MAQENSTVGVLDSQQPKRPIKLGFALLIGPACWLGPYVGVSATLLPAKIGQLAPADKVPLVAAASAIAMTVATIANIIAGALSDVTRSKHGKRTPWIVINSILSALCLVALSMATSVTMLLIVWGIYQAVLNAVVAPMIAQISDRVAPKWRGTISSFYGIGMAFGNYGSGIIASQFIDTTEVGIQVLAAFALIGGLLSAFLAKEPSNLDEPRVKFDAATIKQNFMFPTKGARDYYLALAGKLLMVTGQYVIVGYQLYIFTDYMKLGKAATAASIATMSSILMVTGILFTALAGPISDKMHRLKAPVALTTVLLGVGAFFPFFDAKPWTMFVYALVAGIGMGAYNAVDQALNVAVLPNPNSAAKDLGIINMANTLGQVFGPMIAAVAISTMGYKAMFPVETAICVVGGLLIMMIKRVK
ncbi:MFS transporter [Lentilactobacillus hilgardii]|uniref:MFS transporter n=1 Tax=Lentilactobacillus hilgardii TaxID=1588 RepID=A0A6P1E6T2_LENHI|nr:MFS transporter [Lentilactobacillus hilgardii]MCT3393130.1 MFS transporter [Lentilactobacillus hilgardii]QHB51385.1 MFS transporter [Lentilactobacillus hilgardii]RRG10312.1 MAG: MFS transporter [Lactobacillus sp.]